MSYCKDPVNGLPSVSLTLLSISFLVLLGVGFAEVLGFVKSTGPFTELFYSTCALYFSRRMSVGSKIFGSEKAEEVKKVLE